MENQINKVKALLVKFTSNKKLLIIISGIFLLLITAIIIFVIKKQSGDEVLHQVLGEAEAVMTTKLKVSDGIWDAKRYSDELYLPVGLTVKNGELIVADSMCDRIQIISGEQNLRVGKPGQYGLSFFESGALLDGYRENALFSKPSDVAVGLNGEIIICDTGNHAIRKMDDEFVVTLAGNGFSGYQNGVETEAQFNSPRSVALDKNGIIYVADTMNHCIRQIDSKGNVTLYAGVPTEKGYRDGKLLEAQFYEPCGLYFAENGDLYIADSANHCIRKISNGTVTTVTGTYDEIDSESGYPIGGYVDDEADKAKFNFPRDITMLDDGTLIIADTMNHSIRMLKDGKVKTLIGSGMAEQYYSSLENMKLSRPEGVYVDGETLYISDTANNRVAEVPLTERVLNGRPSREQMLADTGISTDSKYSYKGDIRVFIDGEIVNMGRVAPWNTAEGIYVPIRPLFEALGAEVIVDERNETLSIVIGEYTTVLGLNKDYFIMKGVAVTTADEIVRLFPYTFEWYSEFSMIALCTPADLVRAM